MDDCFEAVGVEEVEVAVGNEAADLEDLVCFGVEAGHLGVISRRCAGFVGLECVLRSRSRLRGR